VGNRCRELHGPIVPDGSRTVPIADTKVQSQVTDSGGERGAPTAKRARTPAPRAESQPRATKHRGPEPPGAREPEAAESGAGPPPESGDGADRRAEGCGPCLLELAQSGRRASNMDP
jgi:hypothetical protein